MKPRFALFCCALFCLLACGLRAKPLALPPEWTLLDGTHFRGTLSGVYGGFVIFDTIDSVRTLGLSQLSESSLEALADTVLSKPAVRLSWSKSTEAVPVALRKKLSILSGTKNSAFSPLETCRTPDFYLIYFSAAWCGPCRRFTPELIKTYKELKASHGDKIELIFVSRDRAANEQLGYVKQDQMPWPFVNFKSLGSVEVLTRWLGPGIPCLVAVTPEGNVIYNSFRGQEYLGPESVVKNFQKLLSLVYGKQEGMQAEAQAFQTILKRRAQGKVGKPLAP